MQKNEMTKPTLKRVIVLSTKIKNNRLLNICLEILTSQVQVFQKSISVFLLVCTHFPGDKNFVPTTISGFPKLKAGSIALSVKSMTFSGFFWA